MTAWAQLYALYSHRARSFHQWQRALYPNFIIIKKKRSLHCALFCCKVRRKRLEHEKSSWAQSRLLYMCYNKESVKFPVHFFQFSKHTLFPKRKIESFHSHKARHNKPIRIPFRMVQITNSAELWLIKTIKFLHMPSRKQTVQGERFMNERKPNSPEHEDCSGWQHRKTRLQWLMWPSTQRIKKDIRASSNVFSLEGRPM